MNALGSYVVDLSITRGGFVDLWFAWERDPSSFMVSKFLSYLHLAMNLISSRSILLNQFPDFTTPKEQVLQKPQPHFKQ